MDAEPTEPSRGLIRVLVFRCSKLVPECTQPRATVLTTLVAGTRGTDRSSGSEEQLWPDWTGNWTTVQEGALSRVPSTAGPQPWLHSPMVTLGTVFLCPPSGGLPTPRGCLRSQPLPAGHRVLNSVPDFPSPPYPGFLPHPWLWLMGCVLAPSPSNAFPPRGQVLALRELSSPPPLPRPRALIPFGLEMGRSYFLLLRYLDQEPDFC